MAEYIEREEVMDALLHEQYGYLCEDAIKSIPVADVQPVVRGKWRLYSPLTDTYECDKCGYQVIDESFRTNFFPNCGADMRPQPPEEE